jgi:shikimate kinase
MILKLKRTPGIFLVGFMGCGKSTVGRALADEVGWRFLDLDEVIETAEGMPISEIFSMRGEAAFRLIETAALRSKMRAIELGQPHVIALGGGAFAQDANVEMLSTKGVSIWLDCPLSMVERRLEGFAHRPLARDLDKLRVLYEERRPAYGRADYRVDVASDDAAATVAQILALGLL